MPKARSSKDYAKCENTDWMVFHSSERIVVGLTAAICKMLDTPNLKLPADWDVAENVSPECGSFESSLRWLPFAVQQATRKAEDYVPIIEETIAFLKAYRRELASCEMWTLAREIVPAILAEWTSRADAIDTAVYFPQATQQRPKSGSEPVDLDELLNGALESRIPDGETTLFETVFTSWWQQPSNAIHRVHLLAFAYRTRCVPTDLPLHRDQLVLHAVFDEAYVSRLWHSTPAGSRGPVPTYARHLLSNIK